MRNLRYFFSLSLIVWIGCSEPAKPQTMPENSQSPEAVAALAALPELTATQVLTKMRDRFKQELAPINNYIVSTDEGLVIYVRKVAQGDSIKIESRTTNRPMPGQEERIYAVNMYEVWNRGGFANLKNIDKIATAFTYLGTESVESVPCYKLHLDRRKLFGLGREGKALFDDNDTSASNEVDVYVDSQTWLIRRIKGKVMKNGKTGTTTVTWGKVVNFKGLNVPQYREMVIEGLTFTDNEIAQVQALIQTQRQQLRDLKNGKLGLPQDQIGPAEEVLKSDILKMQQRVQDMSVGRVTEVITIEEIHQNKNLPAGLFN